LFFVREIATETVLMLQEALSRTLYEWYSRFKGGEISCQDQPRSGRPSTCRNVENLDKIRNAINADRRRTIDEVSEIPSLSWSSCQ